MSVFRSGLRPLNFSSGHRTQGVALGWVRAGLWPLVDCEGTN